MLLDWVKVWWKRSWDIIICHGQSVIMKSIVPLIAQKWGKTVRFTSLELCTRINMVELPKRCHRVGSFRVLLMQTHSRTHLSSPQKTFPLPCREALDATLGNNAMKRGLIEQIAFWLSRLFPLHLSPSLSLWIYSTVARARVLLKDGKLRKVSLDPVLGRWVWIRRGRKGRDVLTLPCIISRMVRVTLGLSVGDRSREAILLE